MISDTDLVQRRKAGESFANLEVATGVNRNTLKGRYRRLVPYEALHTQVDVPRLREMWLRGVSLRAIGREFIVSDETVQGWARRFDLPARPTTQPPCNTPELRWTCAEQAFIIAAGYDLTAAGLAMRLPGRSEKSCASYRQRLTCKGLIARPGKIAGYNRKMRSNPRVKAEPKPPRVKAEPKPPRVKAEPRVRVAKVKAPSKLKPKPVWAVVAPLPPEPAARVLPPGTEALIRRPWSVIKQMALSVGVIMTEHHDLDRFNRRRAQLNLPPVYVTWNGGRG